MRPVPGERERLILGAVALFVLLAACYLGSIGMRATSRASITGDEPFYLITTQSLLDDGDLDLRQQYDRFSYRVFFDHNEPLWRQSGPMPDGRVLSPHAPGLSVFLLPGFALEGLLGAQLQMLLTTALLFALTYVLVARETGEADIAWLATLAVGLTATAFVYATEIYAEVPAGLCVVIALLVLRRGPLGRPEVVALAVLVTLLAWLGTKYAALGALIVLWGVARAARRDGVLLVTLCTMSGAVYVWWHLAIFGGLTPYAVNLIYEGAPTVEVVREHVSILDRAYRITGLWVDAEFGVGRWAPVLLPAVPALALLRRRDQRWDTASLVFALVVTQVLIATFIAITMRGWWFPGRTLLTVLPLLVWPLVELGRRMRAPGRAFLGALGAYSALVTLALARAGAAGEVRVAVDPFALSSALFRAPAALFPDYTAWTPHTVVAHVAWSAAAIVVAALLVRWRWLRELRPDPVLSFADAPDGAVEAPRG
ncbi:MAG: hypothetical protein DWI58_10340 [Chloroflexi bacterium]|nr:MAG: hypothetical protein DWI58_10340 [Chloroflexota bacterium]